MAQLVLSNNSASNPQSIDLSAYMDVNEGSGMDLADPAFTNRVWSRSLLKHGATLSLEQLVEKELTFPLKLGPIGGLAGAPTSLSQTLQFVQNINMILETPGATVTWQPVGASRPTTFDLLSGQLEIAYNFRAEQQSWTFGNLRLFTQPLGRAAAPRIYATASGVGPLLMISPYASSGAQAIGASTQAGVAGFGGQQQGASSGVFYWGSPSLAGDAPALLQISYVGPLPNTATNTGVVPNVTVSLLPDGNYQPLITAPQITFANLNSATNRRNAQTSVASSYLSLSTVGQNSVFDVYSFNPLGAPLDAALEPTVAWTGQHRLLAIARASAAGGSAAGALVAQAGPLVQTRASAGVFPSLDWDLYDLGTFTIRPSAYPQTNLQVQAVLNCSAGASAALDVGALVMLPDNATWFMNPGQITPSQYGYPPNLASQWGAAPAGWTNTIILDDVLGEQMIYLGPSQTATPSPIAAVPSATRMTQYTRGLVPQPDPKNGLPVIAIVGVGQPNDVALPTPIAFPTFSAVNNPAVAANDASNGGTVAWTSTGNVFAVDNTYAVSTITAGQTTEYLKATGYGFSIPTAATIVGIQVTMYYTDSFSGSWTGGGLFLVKGGSTFILTSHPPYGAGGGGYSGGLTAIAGGANDLWGTTWTPADINSSTFGAAVTDAGSSINATLDIDCLTIAVYYAFGSPPQPVVGASQANPQNLRTLAQVNVLERYRYVSS